MTTKPPAKVDHRWPNLYDEDGVFYPETDGMPLPDGEFQGRIFRQVVGPLETWFRDRPNTQVNGNTFIYYEQGNPRRFVSPDCYVAFDVDVGTILYHNTYRIWAVGKPPDFVLEIASPSTARHDIGAKRLLYAQIGFGEYWRYDSTDNSEFYGERLVGERLVEGEYRRFELQEDPDGMLRGHSPTLGLDLCWDRGRLRFYDPASGQYLLDLDETEAARQEAVAAQREAEAAQREAEAALQGEAEARAAAEDELEQLREQLRQLQAQQDNTT